MASQNKIRKVDTENRSFKERWNLDYFSIEYNSKPLCVICRENVAVCKEYNIKRHYKIHEKQYEQYTGEERKIKFKKLVQELEQQQLFMKKGSSEAKGVVKASFKVAYILAKKQKPFLDGEIIKDILLEIAKEICPDKINLFKNLPLSRMTVTRRTEQIGEEVKLLLKEQINNFEKFSLALDESTDISDTAQLLIFIRGVDSNLRITEELLNVCSMKGKTTGADIFQNLEKVMTVNNLSWHKLVNVTTDGARNMSGTKNGLVGRIKSKMESIGAEKVFFCTVSFINRR